MKENPQRFAKANWAAKVRRSYGITVEHAEQTLVDQENKCAICLRDINEQRPPKIDHCHATGKFRGILCQSCNTGLGLFRDDTASLERALQYIGR
jgi:hypothetical protein